MSNTIVIQEARLSYPSLFEKEVFEGVPNKYKCTLIVNKKNKDLMGMINDQIVNALQSKNVKIGKEFWPIRDGEDNEFPGHWLITVGSHSRPFVFDEEGELVSKEDNEVNQTIYPGCWVKASISFWVNLKHTKRVVGELHGVRKLKDDESFSGKHSKAEIMSDLGVAENSGGIDLL